MVITFILRITYEYLHLLRYNPVAVYKMIITHQILLCLDLCLELHRRRGEKILKNSMDTFCSMNTKQKGYNIPVDSRIFHVRRWGLPFVWFPEALTKHNAWIQAEERVLQYGLKYWTPILRTNTVLCYIQPCFGEYGDTLFRVPPPKKSSPLHFNCHYLYHRPPPPPPPPFSS